MSIQRIFSIFFACILALIAFGKTHAQSQSDGNSNTSDQALDKQVFLPFVTTHLSNLQEQSSFEQLAGDLLGMEELFSGGNGKPVTFDSDTARTQGFGLESIALAEELAKHTNSLVAVGDKAETPDVATNTGALSVSLEGYPKVKSFFAVATEYTNKTNNSQIQASGWCSPNLTDAACTCSYWGWTRPSSAAPWVNKSSSNPASTLTSAGYHQTSNNAGGGWTRPRTYASFYCGTNTFRDHAIITGSTTYREQDYSGYTPRGEPNPEVWAGGPWPYLIWPSYVQWWHANF